MVERKIESQRREVGAKLLVVVARRMFINDYGQWGRTFQQRIQRKIVYSVLPVFYCARDPAEAESKVQIKQFLESAAMRSTLRDRIMKVTSAVELLKRNWA